MAKKWKSSVALLVASAASALLANQTEAATSYNRYRGTRCINANPANAGLVYSFQGTLENTNGSGRDIVCPVGMPIAFDTGDDIAVEINGTPDVGSSNGVSCVLYALDEDSSGTVLASVSGVTNSVGWLRIGLSNPGWGPTDVTASLKCYLQNGEQVYSVTEDLTY